MIHISVKLYRVARHLVDPSFVDIKVGSYAADPTG